MNSTKLGGFAYENSGNDVYYLQNGFYQFKGIWKQRGLGKLGSKEIEHLDTFEKDGKYLEPEVITIRKNTEIIWENKDSAAHTITSGTPEQGQEGIFDSSLFMSGTNFSHVLSKKGQIATIAWYIPGKKEK